MEQEWEKRDLPPEDERSVKSKTGAPTRPANNPGGQAGLRQGTNLFTAPQRNFVDRFGADRPQTIAPTRNRGDMRRDLGELRNKRQGEQPSLPPRAASKFKTFFTAEKLYTIKNQVDRGSVKILGKEIGKGVGDFEDVIEVALGLTASNGGGGEAQACQQVIDAVRAYCTDERKTAYEHEKAKGAKGDAKTVQKYEMAQVMRLEARRMQQDRVDEAFLQRDRRQPRDREAAHDDRARQLSQTFGAARAASGTSVVHLIKNADAKVAYAFKSVAGEPTSTGMPKGCGAVREAMASAMSNTIKSMTGLDFGFPEVTIANYGNESGALIEGMDGMCYDPNWLEGKVRAELGDEPDLVYNKDCASPADYQAKTAARNMAMSVRDKFRQTLAAEAQKRKDDASAMAQKLSGKELQKVLLSNYAMAQFDIKWDNMMMQDGPTATARPFDGGAGFLADEALQENPHLLDPGPGGAGYMLLQDPVDTNKDLPAANEAIDDTMRLQFMAINLGELRKSMEAERARLSNDHGLGDKVLPDIAMERSYKSIAIVQEILADPNIRTTRDFVVAYCNRLSELSVPV